MHYRMPASVVVAFLLLSIAPPLVRCETVWIGADQARSLHGPIALGQRIGVVEDGALGDFLVSTVCVAPEKLDGGYAEFRITIPRSGAWYVWARIRDPLGLDGSFAWTAQGEPPTAAMNRCLGKSGAGVRCWHWNSQGAPSNSRPGEGLREAQLTAGELTFRVYPREARESVFQPGHWRMGRPMFLPRLNLICLTTDREYVPTDEDAQRALHLAPSQVDPASLRVQPLRLPPDPRQTDEHRGPSAAPDWLRCPRFFTKDCWRAELASRMPGDIAMLVRQVAANEGSALRLAAYWGGDAYFQSQATPHAPGLGAIDYLQEAVEEGDRLGVAIVLYINPNALFRNHPLFHEAAVRTADDHESAGIAYGVADTHYVCINNPHYRRFLEDLLTEAFTKYKLAGLYVDGLTPHRCFCAHCREKYRSMFGRPMPVEKLARGSDWCVLWEMVDRPEAVGDPQDPDTPRYTEFLARSLAEATAMMRRAVKQARPDAVSLFHSWPKPDTLEFYDGTLTEIYLGAPWKHRLWKFGELANYSNVFSVPVLFNIYLHDHGTEAEARTKAIQGLANGCYPNFWNLLGMRPMFRFMRENAEYLDFARTRPVRFLAFPRSVAHDAAQGRVVRATPREILPQSDLFLAPYVGFYSALVRSGVPVVTVTRSRFHRSLDGLKVLVLANEACMSDEQVEAVRRFVASGGGLVATYETSRYDEKGTPRADFALADVFGVHFERILPAGKRTISAASQGARHPVVERLQPSSEVICGEPQVGVGLCGAETLAVAAGPTANDKPAPAVVAHRFGAGRVVYLPGRLDALQCERPDSGIERLLSGAAGWAAGGELPVTIQASAPVGATLFEQPNRRILHLVSLRGDSLYRTDRVEPLQAIRVELQVPAGARVKRLHRLWDKADLSFQTTAGRIHFELNHTGEYEVVVAELD